MISLLHLVHKIDILQEYAVQMVIYQLMNLMRPHRNAAALEMS